MPSIEPRRELGARLVLIVVAFVAATSSAIADTETAAVAAASNSLETFRKLVLKENAEALGFDDFTKVPTATLELGTAFGDYFIRLDKLKDYSGGPVEPLLEPGSRIFFPVLIDGKPKASVTVVKTNGSWKPGMFGSSQLAQVAQITRELLEKREPSGTEFFFVRIPGLQRVLVGHRRGGKVILTPLAKPTPKKPDATKADLSPGYTLAPEVLAEELLKSLAPRAKDVLQHPAPG